MMVNAYHTQANRERIIDRDQTGAADPTLEEQIKFLDTEITKKQNSLGYYRKVGQIKLAASMAEMIDRMEMKREVLKAQYYASLMDEYMPTFGGAMMLAEVQS